MTTSPTLGVIERILNSWDRVAAATKKVECALPGQMTEAMAELILSREAHERMLVLAARDEHARIRQLDDTPVMMLYLGRPVEEMDEEQLRDALDNFAEDRKRALSLYDDPWWKPPPWSNKEKTAEAMDLFAQRAAGRLKELTS